MTKGNIPVSEVFNEKWFLMLQELLMIRFWWAVINRVFLIFGLTGFIWCGTMN